MAQHREIRKRIKSIKNTAQITKAMELISSVKMRHAQTSALKGRSYNNLMSEILSSIMQRVTPEKHKLFQKGSGKEVVLVISSDRGQCGALNSNLFRKLLNQETVNLDDAGFITVGKKGKQFILATQRSLTADFINPDKPDYSFAKTLGILLINSFLKGEYSSAYVLYTDFKSTIKQESAFIKLLPIEKDVTKDVDLPKREYLFEPNPDTVLESLLPHYIEMRIYQLLLEAAASEHSARMVAMKNATDNALDLVEDLTLTYNRARQEAITKELLDITTSALTVG